MCINHSHQVQFFHVRGNLESSAHKDVVFSLIILKFASGNFEEHGQELIAESKEQYVVMVEIYTIENVFYLPAKISLELAEKIECLEFKFYKS